MRSRTFICAYLIVLLCCPLKSVSAQTLTEDLIAQIRNLALETLAPGKMAPGYAALINMAVHPDISAATYRPQLPGNEDPVFDLYRVPVKHVFRRQDSAWSPFIQANFAYLEANWSLDIVNDERLDTRWRAYGITLTGGVENQISQHLSLIMALNLGLVRMDNEAHYSGSIGNTILKPALAGVIFDWSADALLAGTSLGANYHLDFKSVTTNLQGSFTYNEVDDYSRSSDLIDLGGSITTLALQAETVHPSGLAPGGYPLALVESIGNTSFWGGNRDALGFTHFFEFGLALEPDLERHGWELRKLRLGGKLMFGKDLTGWGLILGYRF